MNAASSPARRAATSCDSSSACTRANVTPGAPAGLPAKAEGSRRENENADLRPDQRRGPERGPRVRARRRRHGSRRSARFADRRARDRQAAPAVAELDRAQRRRRAAARRQRRQRRAVAVRGRARTGSSWSRRVASGGSARRRASPSTATSSTCSTTATPNITGFRIADGRLAALEGSTRPLSRPDADPAQIAFSPDGRTLVVTERGTDSISDFAVDDAAYAASRPTIPSVGQDAVRLRLRADGALSSPRPSAAPSARRRRPRTRSTEPGSSRRSAARSPTRAARSAGRRSRTTAASPT